MSTNEQQTSNSIRNSIALISEEPWTSCYTQFEFDLAIAVQAASRNSNCEMPTGCSACCLLLWQLQLHLQLRLPLLLPFVIIISSSSAAAAQQDTHSNIVTSCHSHCDQVRSARGWHIRVLGEFELKKFELNAKITFIYRILELREDSSTFLHFLKEPNTQEPSLILYLYILFFYTFFDLSLLTFPYYLYLKIIWLFRFILYKFINCVKIP